jgi:transcriptional regulator with XRE-family HTH domain
MTPSKQDGGRKPRQPVQHSPEEKQEITRFIKSLNQAMLLHGLSQRGLCERIGIQVGTLTKYLRGEVAPAKVGFAIQASLARVLGVTSDALLTYYREGRYATDLSLQDVASWIRSEAGQSDLPELMQSLQAAGQRWVGGEEESEGAAERQEKRRPPYTWPIEELQEAGISDRFRERMGLTDERLRLLAETGEFDDELAEAFSVACNYELPAVIEAFRERRAIA